MEYAYNRGDHRPFLPVSRHNTHGRPARLPYLSQHVDDLLADADRLTPLGFVALTRLKAAAWNKPGAALPDDPRELAWIAKVHPRTWARMRDDVLAGWERDDEDRLYLPALRDRRQDVEQRLGLGEPVESIPSRTECGAESNKSNDLRAAYKDNHTQESDSSLPLASQLTTGLLAALRRRHGVERVERVMNSMAGREIRFPAAYAAAALRQDENERPDAVPPDTPESLSGKPAYLPIEVMRMEVGALMADGSPARARRLVDQLGQEALVALVRRLDRGDDARQWFLRVERAAMAMPATGATPC